MQKLRIKLHTLLTIFFIEITLMRTVIKLIMIIIQKMFQVLIWMIIHHQEIQEVILQVEEIIMAEVETIMVEDQTVLQQ